MRDTFSLPQPDHLNDKRARAWCLINAAKQELYGIRGDIYRDLILDLESCLNTISNDITRTP